jgi:hypothetical protein
VKRNTGDEPIGVVIHICMRTTQGNSLFSYLISNNQNYHVFLFIFSFSSTKPENRRQNMSCPRRWWEGHQWEGEVVGKGDIRVNTVQKMCTHACRCKTDTC